MRRKLYGLWITWIFLILIGCENTTEPVFKKEISVKAIISSYWSHQKIYVYYSTENIKKDTNPIEKFVKDATVTIKGGNQTVYLQYVEDNYGSPMYVDIPEKIIIIPGEFYTLTINTDIGEVVGVTQIPDEIKIIEPSNGQLFQDRTPLRVKWDKGSTSPPYAISILEPPIKTSAFKLVRHEKSFYSYENYIDIDSSIVQYNLDYPFYFEYLENDRRYTIYVIAVDDNYKTYYLNAGKSCGITGGYGVFGSATVDSVDFFVIE